MPLLFRAVASHHNITSLLLHEDVHSFVEANLIDRIGDAGKKLHTGRSRNDQVALDMKLYVRSQVAEIEEELKKFQKI